MPALDGFGADLKHHHHLYNAADIVEIKKRSIQTPIHQRKQQKPQNTNIKTLIYSYLLSVILILLRFVQLVQLYSKRIYYIGLDLVESLGLRDSSSSVLLRSSSAVAPNHVCVILNETMIDGIDELSDKISLIVDLMSSHGTRLVTFYAHEQINLELTGKIAKKYSNEDVNNNGNFFMTILIDYTGMIWC